MRAFGLIMLKSNPMFHFASFFIFLLFLQKLVLHFGDKVESVGNDLNNIDQYFTSDCPDSYRRTVKFCIDPKYKFVSPSWIELMFEKFKLDLHFKPKLSDEKAESFVEFIKSNE